MFPIFDALKREALAPPRAPHASRETLIRYEFPGPRKIERITSVHTGARARRAGRGTRARRAGRGARTRRTGRGARARRGARRSHLSDRMYFTIYKNSSPLGQGHRTHVGGGSF